MNDREKRDEIEKLLREGKKSGEIVLILKTSYATIKLVRESMAQHKKVEEFTAVGIPLSDVNDLIKSFNEFKKEVDIFKTKHNVGASYIRGLLKVSL